MHKRARLGKRETLIGCPRYFFWRLWKEKICFLQIHDQTTWGEMYGIANVPLSTEVEKYSQAAFVEKMPCKYVHFLKGTDNK